MLSGANIVVFCLGGSVFAMWYFLSLYLQQVLGYSPIEAGLAFLPMPLTIAACTQAATRLTGRLGAGPVLAGGMALIAVGMLLFTGLEPGRQLPGRRAVPVAALRGRDRLLVRPGDDRRHRGRGARRGGAGVRPRQHVAPDGRLARARAAGDRRDAADAPTWPATSRAPRRSPRASTARSRSAPASRSIGAARERAGAQPRPCGAAKSSAGPIGMIRLGSSESCVV